MNGIPLIASPPVKHESPTNYHGYEVTKYQPPWKTFSDFAMHNDSDDCTQTPGFQHLVNQVGTRTKSLESNFTKIIMIFKQLHGYDLGDEPIVSHHHLDHEWHKNRDSTDSYQESEESIAGSL